MTFSVPVELHRLMKKHSDIKWSEVARHAIWTRARDLELLDKLTAKSAMTLEDVEELDRIVKKGVWDKLSKSVK
ncbi:MAG: hypothetical protein V1921_01515 [Candidatus Altiarchaeota archaeon]